MKNSVIRVVAVTAALMLMQGFAQAEVKTTGDVWLRTGPGLDYESVAILKTGKTYEYLGESSVDERGVTWYRITVGDKTGWVSSRYSELIGEAAGAGEAADEAAEPAPTEAPASQSALDAGILFSQDDTETTPEPALEPTPEPAAEPAPEEAPAPANGPTRAVELSGYYLNNLVETANEIGLISYRQVESEAPYQYYDKALILIGHCHLN